jgi:hypothetical protein
MTSGTIVLLSRDFIAVPVLRRQSNHECLASRCTDRAIAAHYAFVLAFRVRNLLILLGVDILVHVPLLR